MEKFNLKWKKRKNEGELKMDLKKSGPVLSGNWLELFERKDMHLGTPGGGLKLVGGFENLGVFSKVVRRDARGLRGGGGGYFPWVARFGWWSKPTRKAKEWWERAALNLGLRPEFGLPTKRKKEWVEKGKKIPTRGFGVWGKQDGDPMGKQARGGTSLGEYLRIKLGRESTGRPRVSGGKKRC